MFLTFGQLAGLIAALAFLVFMSSFSTFDKYSIWVDKEHKNFDRGCWWYFRKNWRLISED